MKVFLGSVVWRTEETAYASSMRLLVQEFKAQRIPFLDGTVVGDALVSRSRSIVASAFLRSDCDVLLTIDSDIWFRPEDAIALANKGLQYNVIGGLYMTRSLNTQPAMMLPDQRVTFEPNAKPVSVPFLSTGFMAASRKVFEKLAKDLPECHQGWNDKGVSTAFWPFYMPFTIPWEGDGHMYLSEDWAFCQRAKDAGYKVWLDPSIRLGHMGSVMLTLEDLIRPAKPAPRNLTLYRDSEGNLTTE